MTRRVSDAPGGAMAELSPDQNVLERWCNWAATVSRGAAMRPLVRRVGPADGPGLRAAA